MKNLVFLFIILVTSGCATLNDTVHTKERYNRIIGTYLLSKTIDNVEKSTDRLIIYYEGNKIACNLYFSPIAGWRASLVEYQFEGELLSMIVLFKAEYGGITRWSQYKYIINFEDGNDHFPVYITCIDSYSEHQKNIRTQKVLNRVSVKIPEMVLASTSNIPFRNGIPRDLGNIAKKNKLLYNEIGKLPEIQDGISEIEENYLKIINEIYLKTRSKFDAMFIEMNEVGFPHRRKYCTPLQALFWIVENGKIQKLYEIINSYSLEKLLDSS